MTGKYFLDTNFLVYCFSYDEPEKQQKCLEILGLADEKLQFILSAQVLNEFATAMIGKFRQAPLEVKTIIDDLALFEIVPMDAALLKAAIDIHILHQISIWDSLILSAARSAGCKAILTEDLQHNSSMAGVKILNPFLM